MCAKSCPTPWTVAYQAPLWNFPDKNTGMGCYFLLLLPDPGIEPASLVSPALAGRFFTTVPPGKLNRSGYPKIFLYSTWDYEL